MKRKGFTLVELLAVIVVLAIIALIATPTILGVIEKTKQGAAKSSALSYIQSLELYMTTVDLTGTQKLTADETYNLTDVTIINGRAYLPVNEIVGLKGEKPTGYDDYIVLSKKYKVIEGKFTFKDHIVIIEDSDIRIIKNGEKIIPEGMTLNINDQTMERGSNLRIKAIFEPKNTTNQKVEYKSSDSSIVSVDNYGNLTALKIGEATITVISKENTSIEKSVKIEVVRPENVLSIKIIKEDKEVYVGDTNQLIAELEPIDAISNSLTWTSSDENVAYVDENGLVTGINVGRAKITATSVNGVTDTAEIEILEIYPESIEINGEGVAPLGGSIQLIATIMPENTTNKNVIWESTDNSIATIDNNGVVTGLKEGNVTIKAITSNNIIAYFQLAVIKQNDSLIGYVQSHDFDGNSIVEMIVNDTSYSAHIYEYNGDQVWNENITFGDKNDAGTSSTYAPNMVVVKVNGNLTIDDGVTISTYSSTYGGVRGFLLYVTGTLTNNGTISGNSKGAKVESDVENVYLWQNEDESFEYVPSVGASGGKSAHAYDSKGTTVSTTGTAGNPGIGRQTGGGKSGNASAKATCTASRYTATASSSVGGTGNSYSGGSPSANVSCNGSYSTCKNVYCTGTVAPSDGRGGGLVIIYANSIINDGSVTATGSGGYGGGSINIFYKEDFSSNGTLSVTGSGSGTYTIGSIATDTFSKLEI